MQSHILLAGIIAGIVSIFSLAFWVMNTEMRLEQIESRNDEAIRDIHEDMDTLYGNQLYLDDQLKSMDDGIIAPFWR